MALLDNDVLVMDQVSGFLSNDFAIRDQQGQTVGSILTEGSTLSRFFRGSRHLVVVDEQQQPLVRLDDVATFGRDRFELNLPDGSPMGRLVKQFSLFHKSITIELASGEALELQGSLFDHDFQIATADGRQAALVTRRWPGLAAGLLGHNRYVVELAPGLPQHLRATVIGAVIALDLIREKESQAGSSSGGGS